MCRPLDRGSTLGSIAQVHMYGAAPRSPYYADAKNSASDPSIDTELRIKKAAELDMDRFGRGPDLVLYKSGLWDILYHHEIDCAFNAEIIIMLSTSRLVSSLPTP